MHPESSSATEFSISHTPELPLLHPSVSINSTIIYLAAQTGYLGAIPGFLLDLLFLLFNLPPCPVDFMSNIHLEPTHFSLFSLSLMAQGPSWLYLDSSSS